MWVASGLPFSITGSTSVDMYEPAAKRFLAMVVTRSKEQELWMSRSMLVTNAIGTTLWDHTVTFYSSRDAISLNSQ
jgi:hypothetical protein